MSNITPVNPALLAALQQAIDNAPQPQGQLVSLAANLISAPQQLQTIKTQQILSGLVQQVVQTSGGGDTVQISTNRGQVAVQLPTLEKLQLPQDLPVRVVLTPQPPLPNGQFLPPVAQLILEETAIKKQIAPVSSQPTQTVKDTGVNQIISGTQTPRAPLTAGGLSLPLNLLNVLQAEQEKMDAGGFAPRSVAGLVVQANVLKPLQAGQLVQTQSDAGGAAKPQNFFQNLAGRLAPNVVGQSPAQPAQTLAQTSFSTVKPFPLHITQVFPQGTEAVANKPPLGQVGLLGQVQTKLPDGSVTLLVTQQTKPVINSAGQQISLVGHRVVLPAAPHGVVGLETGQMVEAMLPEATDELAGMAVVEHGMPMLLLPPQSGADAANETPAKQTAVGMLFLAALKTGAEPETLHQLAGSLSVRDVAGGLAKTEPTKNKQQLLADMAKLAADDSGLAFTPLNAGWRAAPLPANPQAGIMAAWMHLHIPEDPLQREGQKNESQTQKAGNRFIFDLSLSRMGQMQIDGLVREKNLNVVIRSEQAMSQPMQHALITRFTETVAATGLTGGLRFVVSPPSTPAWTPWNASSVQESVDHSNLTA